MLHRFTLGGYYSIRHRASNEYNQTVLRFVVLNTAVFQPYYGDYFHPADAIEQIQYGN